jgi:hypothetical protein
MVLGGPGAAVFQRGELADNIRKRIWKALLGNQGCGWNCPQKAGQEGKENTIPFGPGWQLIATG